MGRGQELLDAAREGDQRTVEKILGQITKRSGPFTSLRRGAGVNVQDARGYTPLHHACLGGHKDIVHLLLSVDASPCIANKEGVTPLHYAAWRGYSNIVAMLLAHNSPPVNIDQLTSKQESALLLAAQYGYVDVVAQLLAKGADVNLKNIKDETALDLAAQYGRTETVKHLIRARPQLVEPYKYPMSRGRVFSTTPLHKAGVNGHKDVVSALIDAGVDPNVRTYSGTALHESAYYGKAPVVQVLLQKGADLKAVDRRGKTVHDLLADCSGEAIVAVRRVIQEHERNAYGSEDDVPPFPVQDYSPTSYPGAVGLFRSRTLSKPTAALSLSTNNNASVIYNNAPENMTNTEKIPTSLHNDAPVLEMDAAYDTKRSTESTTAHYNNNENASNDIMDPLYVNHKNLSISNLPIENINSTLLPADVSENEYLNVYENVSVNTLQGNNTCKNDIIYGNRLPLINELKSILSKMSTKDQVNTDVFEHDDSMTECANYAPMESSTETKSLLLDFNIQTLMYKHSSMYLHRKGDPGCVHDAKDNLYIYVRVKNEENGNLFTRTNLKRDGVYCDCNWTERREKLTNSTISSNSYIDVKRSCETKISVNQEENIAKESSDTKMVLKVFDNATITLPDETAGSETEATSTAESALALSNKNKSLISSTSSADESTPSSNGLIKTKFNQFKSIFNSIITRT